MVTRKNPDRESLGPIAASGLMNGLWVQTPSMPIRPALLRQQKVLRAWRPSFTLIELLATISIIGVLAGLTLIALSGAQRDAEISRTRATIRKINEIILAKWEEYPSRSIPISIPPSATLPNANGTIPLAAREAARLRLIGLRDLMRMEMPDRRTDVQWSPTLLEANITVDGGSGPTTVTVPVGNLPFPADWAVYRSRLGFPGAIWSSADPHPPQAMGASAAWSDTNDSAELLFLICTSSHNQESGGLDGFRSSEIGDTDADGFPEFLDAWGRPIVWLRWPAGAIGWSEIVQKAFQDVNVVGNTDPFDPVKADIRYDDATILVKPYALQPLIVSAGGDGIYNIQLGDNSLIFASQTVGVYYYPDPYSLTIGAQIDSSLDPDITSHDVEGEL